MSVAHAWKAMKSKKKMFSAVEPQRLFVTKTHLKMQAIIHPP